MCSVKPTAIFIDFAQSIRERDHFDRLGFVQSNPKKLAAKTIHRTSDVILYADLLQAMIPIYEERAALLYTALEFGGQKDPGMNAYIVREFGSVCKKKVRR